MYADVDTPTIVTNTAGKDFIYLAWSPPSKGSPLSYTITWTPSSVMLDTSLPSTARNYTIWGLESNTHYSGTVEAYSLVNNATAPWERYTLPQGELLLHVERCIQGQLYSAMWYTYY